MILIIGLLIIFGPIGLLAGILNVLANRRHKKLIAEIRSIERNRMRLENPAAFSQLQSEESGEKPRQSVSALIKLGESKNGN